MTWETDELIMVITIDDEGGERKGEQRLWRRRKGTTSASERRKKGLGFVLFVGSVAMEEARRQFGDHVRQACEGLNEKKEVRLDSRTINGGLGCEV